MSVPYSEIYKEMTFDTGHRIVGHKGKCARLHGHTYRAVIRCAGAVRDPGFVVDFGDIKELVNEWDHFLLLWAEDPFFQELRGVIPDVVDTYGIKWVTFNPTAENMAQDLAQRMADTFDLLMVQIELFETPTSSATAIVNRGAVAL